LWLIAYSVAFASCVIVRAVDKSVLGSKSLKFHCSQAISTLLWNSMIQSMVPDCKATLHWS
ncbi:hypothetical protein BAE44_0008314, partial [Dichanthelium oligosanthes]